MCDGGLWVAAAQSAEHGNKGRYERGLHFYRNKEFTRAIAELQQVTNEDPSNYEAFLLAGQTTYELKEWYLAEAYLLEASYINNSDPRPYTFLSAVFEKIGDLERSRFYLKKALALNRGHVGASDKEAPGGPIDHDAEGLRAILQELKNTPNQYWGYILTANQEHVNKRTLSLLAREVESLIKRDKKEELDFVESAREEMHAFMALKKVLSVPSLRPSYEQVETAKLRDRIRNRVQTFPDTPEPLSHKSRDTATGRQAVQNIHTLIEATPLKRSEQIIELIQEEGARYANQDNLDAAISVFSLESNLYRLYSTNTSNFLPGAYDPLRHYEDSRTYLTISPQLNEIISANPPNKRVQLEKIIRDSKIDPIALFQLIRVEYESLRQMDTVQLLIDVLPVIQEDRRFETVCIFQEFQGYTKQVIGEVRLREQKLEEAAAYLKQALGEYKKAKAIRWERAHKGIALSSCPEPGIKQFFDSEQTENPMSRVYSLLISIYRSLGDQKLVEQCEKEREETDTPLETRTRSNVYMNRANAFTEIANILFEIGSFDRGMKYLKLALLSADTYCTFLPNPSVRGHVLHRLAVVLSSAGFYRQAKVAVVRAIAYDMIVDTDGLIKNMVPDYYRLARIYDGLHQPVQALESYKESERNFDLRTIKRGVAWEWELFYRLGLAHGAQGDQESAYKAYTMAITLVESMTTHVKADRHLIGLEGNTNAVYEEMVELVINKIDKKEEAFFWIEKGKSNALSTLLRARGLSPKETLHFKDLAAVRSLLKDAGTCLLEYYATPRAIYVLFLDADNYLIRPLTHHGNTISPEDLNELLVGHGQPEDQKSLLAMLTYPRTKLSEIQERSRDGFEILFPEVIQSKVTRHTKMIVVPHGPLHLIPFAALSDPGGFLFHKYEISYSPSANIWITGHRRSTDIASQPDRVLAVLNPAGDERIDIRNQEKTLVEIYRNADTRIARHMSADELLAEFPKYNILHLYTHGTFDVTSPLDSSLALTQSNLTAKDLYSKIELEPSYRLEAKFIIMAFCESGAGQALPGDEVLGLPRAFIYGGATTIVATLWKGERQFTERLFLEFHKILRAEPHTSKSRALKAAISATMATDSQFEHPFFWAPFILVGSS